MGQDPALTRLVSCRVSKADDAFLSQIGGGSSSTGIRKAIGIAKQANRTGGIGMAASSVGDVLRQVAAQLDAADAARAADVTSTPSGAGWLPQPSPELIIGFHEAMPTAVLAMPTGLMAWGKGPGGEECSLVVDAANGQLGLADAGNPTNVMVPLEGLADLAAIADALAQAHHLARLAAAQGKPIISAVAKCPGLQLQIRPADAKGMAVIEVAGAAIQMPPLVFLQLMAEASSLLAREVARSVDQRQSLEQLLPVRPVLVGERSHGEG
jgi:hypothetical protein